MRELTDREYQFARQAVERARERIKANGGKCGYGAIDKHAKRGGSEWAKKLLARSRAHKWSYNEAKELSEAVKKCEMARVTKMLCEANGGINEQELRGRYNVWSSSAIAGAEGNTSVPVKEIVPLCEVGILLKYDIWLRENADREVIYKLEEMTFGLLCHQVWASRKPRSGGPYSCAMLYEPGEARAIASEIARFLVDQNVINGPRKDRHRRAQDALIKLFADSEAEFSFQESCRSEFWSRFQRWNTEEVISIERRMQALNEGMGRWKGSS
jgi:hypothetical protein